MSVDTGSQTQTRDQERNAAMRNRSPLLGILLAVLALAVVVFLLVLLLTFLA